MSLAGSSPGVAARSDPTTEGHRFRQYPLMGTEVEVRMSGVDARVAEQVCAQVVREIVRLEGVFSAFDARSELCRWRRGEPVTPSPELCELMGLAHHWQERSGGTFNPAVGVISGHWRRAEEVDREPSPTVLAALAASIDQPVFEMIDGVPEPTGDCRHLNVNAVAKGYIVERAIAAAVAGFELETLAVSAGGDVAHRGSEPMVVGIENPFRPYDNEPPLTFVPLRDAALATSGSAHRGFVVAGRRFSHVIDPRTGHPVEHTASTSVVAPDLTTADVVATAIGVHRPETAVELVEAMEGVGCLIIDRRGGRWSDSFWRDTADPAWSR